MKHLIYLLLLLTPTITFAQNEDYRLFRDGVQYLYGYANPNQTSFGIKVNGTCDSTYAYLADDYECATEYPSLLLKPAFAGYEVCQEANVTTLRMKNDRLVTLYPRSILGQSWEATSEANTAIWAVVDSIKLTSVLGLVDSVKFISFHADNSTSTTLNTIRIGKTLGLVSSVYFWDLLGCPTDFVLTGVSEPDAGVKYPPVVDFFAPSSDQEIHFQEKIYGGGAFLDPRDSSYFQYHEYKLQLENWVVEPGGDSLTYTYRGGKLGYRIDVRGNQTPYDSILRDDYLLVSTISRAEYHALDQLPGTMSPFFFDGQQQPIPDNRDVTNLLVTELSCFGAQRRFGKYYELQGELAQYYTDGFPGNAYVEGIGMPFYRYGNFDVIRARKLVYRKDDNRECGTPYDFTGIVATPVSANVLPLDRAIRLFPNPANGRSTLRLPTDGLYEVNIVDLHGRRLANHSEVNGEVDLNLQDLPVGVYVVTVTQRGKLLGRRRLVVR